MPLGRVHFTFTQIPLSVCCLPIWTIYFAYSYAAVQLHVVFVVVVLVITCVCSEIVVFMSTSTLQAATYLYIAFYRCFSFLVVFVVFVGNHDFAIAGVTRLIIRIAGSSQRLRCRRACTNVCSVGVRRAALRRPPFGWHFTPPFSRLITHAVNNAWPWKL